jgi:hypothetical protein
MSQATEEVSVESPNQSGDELTPRNFENSSEPKKKKKFLDKLGWKGLVKKIDKSAVDEDLLAVETPKKESTWKKILRKTTSGTTTPKSGPSTPRGDGEEEKEKKKFFGSFTLGKRLSNPITSGLTDEQQKEEENLLKKAKLTQEENERKRQETIQFMKDWNEQFESMKNDYSEMSLILQNTTTEQMDVKERLKITQKKNFSAQVKLKKIQGQIARYEARQQEVTMKLSQKDEEIRLRTNIIKEKDLKILELQRKQSNVRRQRFSLKL